MFCVSWLGEICGVIWDEFIDLGGDVFMWIILVSCMKVGKEYCVLFMLDVVVLLDVMLC